MTSEWLRLVGAAAVAGLGLVAVGLTLGLPWDEPAFHLGPLIRVIMVMAGVTIMIVAARPGLVRVPGLQIALLLLGGTVLIYPTTLSLAAAGLGAPIVQLLGMSGHVVPLVLVQLLPVLATQIVTGRSRRAWLTVIIGVAVGGLALTIYALQEICSFPSTMRSPKR